MATELSQKVMIQRVYDFLIGFNGDGFIIRDKEWKDGIEKKFTDFYAQFDDHKSKTVVNCPYLAAVDDDIATYDRRKTDGFRIWTILGIIFAILTPWAYVVLTSTGVIKI